MAPDEQVRAGVREDQRLAVLGGGSPGIYLGRLPTGGREAHHDAVAAAQQMDPGSVVLSPHLDDAVLSCWHVLTQPGEVTVVNVFSGIPVDGGHAAWWDRFTGARSSQERMRERLAEDADALSLVGRAAINLGFLDDQYRRDRQPIEPVVERLAAMAGPRTRIYAPAALGGVADHEVVRAAAVALLHRGRDVVLYADLPHAVRAGWPASVTGASRDPLVDVEAWWKAEVARSLPGGGHFEVHALDERAHAAKQMAIRRYRTQLPALLAMHPHLAEPQALRYEVTWRPR